MQSNPKTKVCGGGEFIVPGLIPRRGVFLLIGPPKSGKSRLITRLAVEALIRGARCYIADRTKTSFLSRGGAPSMYADFRPPICASNLDGDFVAFDEHASTIGLDEWRELVEAGAERFVLVCCATRPPSPATLAEYCVKFDGVFILDDGRATGEPALLIKIERTGFERVVPLWALDLAPRPSLWRRVVRAVVSRLPWKGGNNQ